jgi:hypothetical protein
VSDLDLFNTFVDLHEKLSGRGISIILGGGLGLYLKQLSLIERPVRTLIDASGWPQPRSTSDIDVFFPLEVLVSLDFKSEAMRLGRTGYGTTVKKRSGEST